MSLSNFIVTMKSPTEMPMGTAMPPVRRCRLLPGSHRDHGNSRRSRYQRRFMLGAARLILSRQQDRMGQCCCEVAEISALCDVRSSVYRTPRLPMSLPVRDHTLFPFPSPLFNLPTPLAPPLPTHRGRPTNLKLHQSSLALSLAV